MQTVVEWKEKYRGHEGDMQTRHRAYYYNGNGKFYDSEDYRVTAEIDISLLADKEIEDLNTHEARKIVAFAKKEQERLDGDNNN